MSSAVRIHHLTKHYFLESVTVRALRGVSLTVERGEFVALMGPSGSGKSTLLNLLGCLDRPTDGSYILGEDDVSRMDDDRLSEIRSKYLGFIFQSYNLLPQYTVTENIEIPLLYQGCRINEKTAACACVQLLRRSGGIGRSGSIIVRCKLSGGQQQRVAIARALVNDPHLILADEPTGNLDSKTSDEIMQMLIRLNDAGKTIIMVTHENDIAAWARRVIRMRTTASSNPTSRNEQPRAAHQGVTPAFVSNLNSLAVGGDPITGLTACGLSGSHAASCERHKPQAATRKTYEHLHQPNISSPLRDTNPAAASC